MHLMRKCPCPVWIDRAGDEPAYHRILAAIDPLDDESGNLQQLILDLATSLAEREHATLDVVHAWEMPGESMLASGRHRIPRTELDLSAVRLGREDPQIGRDPGHPRRVDEGGLGEVQF